jgi:hypothetical protein
MNEEFDDVQAFYFSMYPNHTEYREMLDAVMRKHKQTTALLHPFTKIRLSREAGWPKTPHYYGGND